MASRRGFLKMLGGALAAPLMPSVSFAAASKAAYPASALHAAIYHAQTRVNFSAFALAQKLQLQIPQAEALMADMSARGILGPLQGQTQSGRWALSKVWNRSFVDAAAAQNTVRAKAARDKRLAANRASEQGATGADLKPFLSHLYDICRAQGRVLHPRCADLVRG
jgi:hypothetical protein